MGFWFFLLSLTHTNTLWASETVCESDSSLYTLTHTNITL